MGDWANVDTKSEDIVPLKSDASSKEIIDKINELVSLVNDKLIPMKAYFGTGSILKD